MNYIGDSIIRIPLDECVFPDVMGGRKKSAITLLGQTPTLTSKSFIRFVGIKRNALSCVVRVTNKRQLKTKELTENEAKNEGLKDVDTLRKQLSKYYPHVSDDSMLTVIEFDPPIEGKIGVAYDNIDPQKYDDAARLLSSDIGWGSWTDDFKGVWDILNLTREELDSIVGVEVHRTDEGPKRGRLDVDIRATNIDWSYNGIPALLSMVAGSVLGSSYFSGTSKDGGATLGARIAKLELPESVERQFYGPRLGIDGVRKLCNVKDRPLVAFTVKPRIGLSPEQFARVCVAVAKGGVDIVEDDERLSNQSFCDLLRRADTTINALARANLKTIYSANITGRSDQIVEVARDLVELGVCMLKIDVLPAGFGALQAVSEYLHRENKNVGITVFPAMNAVYDKIGKEQVLSLSRLCGADIIYAGIPPFSNNSTDNRVQDAVRFTTAVSHHGILRRAKPFQRNVLPTVSTNINPYNIGAYAQFLGNNVGFFVGGGIAANPYGLTTGAEMLMKALIESKKDDPSIFTNEEQIGFGNLFGNFVKYEDLPKEIKNSANSIRGL